MCHVKLEFIHAFKHVIPTVEFWRRQCLYLDDVIASIASSQPPPLVQCLPPPRVFFVHAPNAHWKIWNANAWCDGWRHNSQRQRRQRQCFMTCTERALSAIKLAFRLSVARVRWWYCIVSVCVCEYDFYNKYDFMSSSYNGVFLARGCCDRACFCMHAWCINMACHGIPFFFYKIKDRIMQKYTIIQNLICSRAPRHATPRNIVVRRGLCGLWWCNRVKIDGQSGRK